METSSGRLGLAEGRFALTPRRWGGPLYGGWLRDNTGNWSKRASTRQHNKILVSGTIGAFRLCSDKRLEQFRTYI